MPILILTQFQCLCPERYFSAVKRLTHKRLAGILAKGKVAQKLQHVPDRIRGTLVPGAAVLVGSGSVMPDIIRRLDIPACMFALLAPTAAERTFSAYRHVLDDKHLSIMQADLETACDILFPIRVNA